MHIIMVLIPLVPWQYDKMKDTCWVINILLLDVSTLSKWHLFARGKIIGDSCSSVACTFVVLFHTIYPSLEVRQ